MFRRIYDAFGDMFRRTHFAFGWLGIAFLLAVPGVAVAGSIVAITEYAVRFIPSTSGNTLPSNCSSGRQCLGVNASNQLIYYNGSTTTVLGSGGGSGTLATTYSNGASTSDSTMSLNSTNGPPVIKDNATPIGTLFQVETNGAANIFSLSPSTMNLAANYSVVGASSATNTNGVSLTSNVADGASSIGLLINNSTTLSSGVMVQINNNGTENFQFAPNGIILGKGTADAKLRLDDSFGTRLQYINDTLTAGGTGWGMIGTNAPALNLSTASIFNGNGSSAIVATMGSVNTRFGVTSGVTDVYCNATDQTADTSGTTVNLLVAASSNNKVQKPAATANLTTIVGVALTTATSGNAVTVAYSGDVMVGCDGTVAVGDELVSSGTTAGRVITNNSATAGAFLGVARETCGNTVANQVRMHMR